MILPVGSPKVSSVVRGKPASRSTKRLAGHLNHLLDQRTLPQAKDRSLSDLCKGWETGTLSTAQNEEAKIKILSRAKNDRCHCSQLMSMHPNLRTAVGHVVLRTSEQWGALLGPAGQNMLGRNARNELFPTPLQVQQSSVSVREYLQTVTVPQIEMSGNALFHDTGIFSESQILDLSKKIFSTLETETMAGCKSFPWLDGERAETFSDTLMSFGLVGGVWDKHPHRPYAVCSSLEEIKVCEKILFGSKFSIWGWGDTPSAAACITLEELIATPGCWTRLLSIKNTAWHSDTLCLQRRGSSQTSSPGLLLIAAISPRLTPPSTTHR